jgi:hypothetical protein
MILMLEIILTVGALINGWKARSLIPLISTLCLVLLARIALALLGGYGYFIVGTVLVIKIAGLVALGFLNLFNSAQQGKSYIDEVKRDCL